MRPNEIALFEHKARQIRATSVQMAHDAGIGHVGSALSCVEALLALFYHWLRLTPGNIGSVERDRFILSKGHACASLYSILADRGFFPRQWLHRYGEMDGPLPDHPCKHALPLLECPTGSLGHGLGVATGMLYGLRLRGVPARTAVLMGDGECNEGSVWESAMFAAAQGLDNLLVLVDENGIQAVGRSAEIMGHTSLEEKFRAFGWGACSVEGNHLPSVLAALDRFPLENGKPSAVILRTTKGAGVSFMEDQVLWHYRVPSDEDLRNSLRELRAAPLHLCESA